MLDAADLGVAISECSSLEEAVRRYEQTMLVWGELVAEPLTAKCRISIPVAHMRQRSDALDARHLSLITLHLAIVEADVGVALVLRGDQPRVPRPRPDDRCIDKGDLLCYA